MDWIEEKIEQIRIFLHEKSLVTALVCYLCIGMLGVGTLYWITRNFCLAWAEVISLRYQEFMGFHSFWGGVWSANGMGAKEKFLFSSGVSLGILTILQGCLHMQESLANTRQKNGSFIQFLSL